MNIAFAFLLIIISFTAFADNSSICGSTESDEQLLKLIDNQPRSDDDYSEKKGIESLKRLQAYLEGKEVPYFIPQNTLSIIKGAYLKKSMLESESRLKKANLEDNKQNNSLHNLKYRYAKAKSEYCEHQRTEFHIDW